MADLICPYISGLVTVTINSGGGGEEGLVIFVLATGAYHTIGLESGGSCIAVGLNLYGQCDVDVWTDITQVSGGFQHTIGLKSDGSCVAIGMNTYYQCNVGSWTDITQVSGGMWHTLGLKSNGTCVAIGFSLFFPLVDTWTDLIQVAAGLYHNVGLKSDGTCVAESWNDDGQCDVGSWTDITQVAIGGYHTVGLRANGSCVATGRNDDGQCDVGSWTNIIQISSKEYHTVGLRANGSCVATGRNDEGQCDVGSWTNIIQVVAGWYHTIGLKSDGTCVAVGLNDQGQCDVGSWSISTEVGGSEEEISQIVLVPCIKGDCKQWDFEALECSVKVKMQTLKHMHQQHLHFKEHSCIDGLQMVCGTLTQENTHNVLKASILVAEAMGNGDLDNNNLIYCKDFIIDPNDPEIPPMLVIEQQKSSCLGITNTMTWLDYLNSL